MWLTAHTAHTIFLYKPFKIICSFSIDPKEETFTAAPIFIKIEVAKLSGECHWNASQDSIHCIFEDEKNKQQKIDHRLPLTFKIKTEKPKVIAFNKSKIGTTAQQKVQ